MKAVLVFIDELYLHLIQSDEHFNRALLSLDNWPKLDWRGSTVLDFWRGPRGNSGHRSPSRRNYDTELMGKLSGQSGRFQSINIPVTQFHRIYNHRLFRENSKCVHKLADAFKAEIQPHFRGAFTDFLKRYFREREPITDEAKHFADVYPMHPFGLYCLTAITNRGGRSRGALGFVQEFIERRLQDTSDWKRIAVLDDVFDYEDLRNKIIQDDPEMAKYYGCSSDSVARPGMRSCPACPTNAGRRPIRLPPR
jgi:ferredoxin